jgi:hypothetical protein
MLIITLHKELYSIGKVVVKGWYKGVRELSFCAPRWLSHASQEEPIEHSVLLTKWGNLEEGGTITQFANTLLNS